ncbi:MAG: polysaccharide biosynthesis protein [Tannerella sp.]|jgi:FlaA1/EpsC-like NDP-sugar epimerase|nr:polysaccharide biosynthesis protein [Tannerella sp.]
MAKKIINYLLQLKYFNRWLIFFTDLCFSVCATGMSLLFASEFLEFSAIIKLEIIPLSIGCSIVSFVCFRTYKSSIRHADFTEAGRIGVTALFKAVLLISAISLFIGFPKIYQFIFGIAEVFFTFFGLLFLRIGMIFSYKYILHHFNKVQTRDNLLIFAHGLPQTSFMDSSFQDLEKNYRIVGFFHFGTHASIRIGSYKMYSIQNQEDFDELVTRNFIKAVLFLKEDAVKEESERLIRFCEKKKIRMLILPCVNELKKKGERINYRNLPEVRIENLLEREEIKIDMDKIVRSVKEKVVLVTGAAGSIGSELCRQLCIFNVKELVLFDCAETPMHNIRLELEERFPDVRFHPVMGDVRHKDRLESVFSRFQPQLVFHAAAYKHVPLMEENPCEAIRTNVFGTMQVANLATKYRVEKFVMISTDKAVNPTNVMGASKRLAEIYVQSLGLAIRNGEHQGITRFITTRFGNVLGSNGSVIPRFREQLAKGGPLTVTHPEITRYFMTIPEACRLVLEAACMGSGNEVFVFDMGNPVKIANLARRMIELAGLEPGIDVQISYTGLRPGEKLYEELLTVKENSCATANEKIFRARVHEYDHNEITPKIIYLCDMAKSEKTIDAVRLMKRIIPEFISKHSAFEHLDKAEKIENEYLLNVV